MLLGGKWICCWEGNKTVQSVERGECVSVTAGETEWLWGFVELQQVVCGGGGRSVLVWQQGKRSDCGALWSCSRLCVEGAECVSVTAGETEWLWGFVELQQVGVLGCAAVPTCVKGLSVIMMTEVGEGGVCSGVARAFEAGTSNNNGRRWRKLWTVK
jgi:hypothetical protein